MRVCATVSSFLIVASAMASDIPGFIQVVPGQVPGASVAKVMDTRCGALVLIDRGNATGFRPGMILEIIQEDAVAGEIQVVETRENRSACVILSAKSVIKAQDTVRAKLIRNS